MTPIGVVYGNVVVQIRVELFPITKVDTVDGAMKVRVFNVGSTVTHEVFELFGIQTHLYPVHAVTFCIL